MSNFHFLRILFLFFFEKTGSQHNAVNGKIIILSCYHKFFIKKYSVFFLVIFDVKTCNCPEMAKL